MSLHNSPRVSALLAEIRAEMEALELWQSTPPSAEALASSQPFCVDTLTFCEWLQWLLIPRLDEMIRRSLPLPQNSQIHPMAEEAFKLITADTDQLLALIEQLDRSLCTLH